MQSLYTSPIMCRSTEASQHPKEGDILIISLRQTRKLRPRELKQLAQENTALVSGKNLGLGPRLSGSTHILLPLVSMLEKKEGQNMKKSRTAEERETHPAMRYLFSNKMKHQFKSPA